MGTIRFTDGATREFISVLDRAKDDPVLRKALEKRDPGEVKAATCIDHPGSEDEPQLFEVDLPANAKVPPHAHDADEIVVVTRGEVHFGRQVYGVGSSIYIPAMTLYSFQAGPEGLRFLNFRPRQSKGSLGVEELAAARAERRG
jgi:mannose-6-phosphate isomerase-like protein (cupin superfamily)